MDKKMIKTLITKYKITIASLAQRRDEYDGTDDGGMHKWTGGRLQTYLTVVKDLTKLIESKKTTALKRFLKKIKNKFVC